MCVWVSLHKVRDALVFIWQRAEQEAVRWSSVYAGLFLSSTAFTHFTLVFDSWQVGHPGFGGVALVAWLALLSVCLCVLQETECREGAGNEARGRPEMAGEGLMEDLPGDPPIDSSVFTELGDIESSVGNYYQSRPEHGCLLFFLLWPLSSMSASSFTSC